MPDPKSSAIFRVRELEVRYRPHRLDSPIQRRLAEPAIAAGAAAELLRGCATEVLLVLHLNAKHRLLGMHRIPGAISSVAVSIAEICRAVLLSNASAVVLAHNHPSGDPAPSGDDRQLVQRLRNVLLLLDIQLLDAVVVVDPAEGGQYFSFRQDGLL